jgi:hypothetical protein
MLSKPDEVRRSKFGFGISEDLHSVNLKAFPISEIHHFTVEN